MTQSEPILVTGNDGLRGTVIHADHVTEAGERHALVQFENGQQLLVPATALVRQADGSYHLAIGLADLQRYQSQGDQVDRQTAVLPVIEEELDIHKRAVVTGGVRISKLVRERQEVVDQPLLREEVNVERVAVNRPIDSPVEVRYEGDTMIIPIVEERLVIQKQLVLTEELRVTRRQVTTSQPQQVTLRSEEAVVERISPDERQLDRGKDLA